MIRPTATYRLQLRGDMDLHKAADLVPYLKSLGVSHLYASPIFAATPGSTHGYDVIDFCAIEPGIGGDDGLRALTAALREHGIGLILDFVPNHMGASPHNAWWRNVLEWGRESDFAEHFDIDWSAPKLVAPVLGQPYGEALEQGLLGLAFDARDGGISFTYYDLALPLTPPSYARLLARIEADPVAELARRFAVARPETAAQSKEELARLAGEADFRPLIDAALAATVADRAALHDLHEAQVWRAAYWRAAREGLTYRRFFEIADLVGIRVERSRVFDDVHPLLFRLISEGGVEGVRLDHIDGLADPKGYLERLQQAIGGDKPFYLLVEKILGPGETLPASWPVAGTTGYEFIEMLAGLLVDPSGAAAATEAYHAFLGGSVDYVLQARETKRRMLTRNLAGELEALRDLARAVAAGDPVTRDYGADSLRRAIVEIAAALPVYRTYVNVEGPGTTCTTMIESAAESARATREVEDEGAIRFVSRLLRLDFPDPDTQGAALVFATRFQQTTGPVMAKAIEDTLFYRYNRLIALNEVGGDPGRFGAPVADFHAAMHARHREQPLGLSATATHDTKRGEDTRARLYAIGEMPEVWRDWVVAWSGRLSGTRGEVDGVAAPEPEIEWLFYQALAGAWPAEPDPGADALAALGERMQAYMLKVVREAKLRTSWASPAPEYEEKVAAFVGAAFDNPGFIADFGGHIAPLIVAGAVNSLAQLAIKLAAPGVPDIYQGTEFWDLSLVDPDNRRSADFSACAATLAADADASPEELSRDWRSGRAKLRLLAAGLKARRDHPQLFAEGEYLPLETAGSECDRLVAFARRSGDDWLIAITPRLPLRLLGGSDRPLIPPRRWGDTRIELPEAARGRRFRDIVLDREMIAAGALSAADALDRFPVALLISVG